jgi:CDP-diacylglycerol--glycerol-3-phosphate 3-phosphatidyltransferase
VVPLARVAFGNTMAGNIRIYGAWKRAIGAWQGPKGMPRSSIRRVLSSSSTLSISSYIGIGFLLSGVSFRPMQKEQKELNRPITYWIGEGAGWLLRHVVNGLAATGVTPNMFTFFGLAVNSWAAALFALGRFRQAAAVLFLAGFLDMADGQVARRVGRVTAFGAFLDSTLDRYSDLALYMGLVVYYTLAGRPFYMTLAAVAMASSFMVSYSRARAESLIPSCKVGFMERPERLVLLLIGGTFNRMAQVLWVIATISTITVIHRVVYTWQELRAGRSLPEASVSQSPSGL